MDFMPYVTIIGTLVVAVGGMYSIKESIKKSQIERDTKVIHAIKSEVSPLQLNLEQKERDIKSLCHDLEELEDKLNQLQVDVARTSGFVDVQTPLIAEIRTQIVALQTKIESIKQVEKSG